MADNFVSEFTVNSQGTDIDVKIKDADARNLIAQEISDRSELISKDTNGNTNVTSKTGDVAVSGKNITNNATSNIETSTKDKTESVTGTETATKNIVNETVNNLTLVGKNELKFKSDSLVLDSNGEPIKLGMNVTDDLYYGTLKVREATGNVREIMVKNNGTPNLARSFNNYILVGDSYAEGWTPDGNVTGWPVLLHGLLKGNLYGTITQGGAGLSAELTGDFNLTTKIDSFANSDDVDSIICCCGRNDIGSYSLAAGVSEGIKNFVNKCHEKFKNARIYIGFIGWDLNKTEYDSYKSYHMSVAIANYQNVNADYTYINTDFILRQRSLMASDGKHPNQNGQNALAYGIQCALYGGTPAFTKRLAQHKYKDIYDGNAQWILNETFVGGTTFLQFIHNINIMYKAGTGESVTLNNYELPIVKNVELEYLIPSAQTTMQTTILLKMNEGTFYTFDAPVHFKDNGNGTYDLIMNMTCVSHDGQSWASGIIAYFIIYDSITVANLLA